MSIEDDITALTTLVQRMVDESGDSVGFNAQAWLNHWLMGELHERFARDR